MSKWKVIFLVGVVLMICVQQAKADTSPVVLTFEGVGDLVPVGNFYNGGAGGNLGIVFGPDSLALVSILAGGSGAFSNAPSGDTVAFFETGTGDLMNVAAGFTTGVSFFYSAAGSGSVMVWSGLNGTGTLLASLSLPPNPGSPCMPSIFFCNWTAKGVTFAGTAESVNFGGAPFQIAFDNITLGSATAGGGTPTPAPEPATMLLLGVGSFGLLTIARRNKSV
jgi:hypothetical protein